MSFARIESHLPHAKHRSRVFTFITTQRLSVHPQVNPPQILAVLTPHK